jgi:chemotaxis protein CheD
MAEIELAERAAVLKTTLGSCVGVVLHDGRRGVGGMAHVVLPQRTGTDEAVGKYADTAIPALLERLCREGSRPQDVRAFVAGGASMFPRASDRVIATIGEKNVEAARRILTDLAIPIAFEDTGGEQGRTVLFDNATATIEVKKLERIMPRGGAA